MSLLGCTAPRSKLLTIVSNFNQNKSKHEDIIKTHWFNSKMEIIIPSTQNKSSFRHKELKFVLARTSLVNLLSDNFVQSTAKSGMYGVTIGTEIDKGNAVCVLPTGKMIMSLDKDTYQELGLSATKANYPRKGDTRWMVNIDLSHDSFRPGRKLYDRVMWSLTNRVTPVNMMLNHSSKNIYLKKDESVQVIDEFNLPNGVACLNQKCAVSKRLYKTLLTAAPVIDMNLIKEVNNNISDGSNKKITASESLKSDLQDVYHWIGAVHTGSVLYMADQTMIDPRVSRFSHSIPTVHQRSENSESDESMFIHTLTYDGMILPEAVLEHLKRLSDLVNERKNRSENKDQAAMVEEDDGEDSENEDYCCWAALTVWGIEDSPVSWKENEHNVAYDGSGENDYTFIVLPNYNYIAFVHVSANDQYI
eukprot:TRINITY_DN7846_c0_g1_i2.p1 TRINITY_DN7846_c0_g1~~TRINITY_DN7846_c0_g1_i2.p1  ORF type:complete len:419 (-),score=50.25 TRINITY_DN7846_c0_g1_i2:49-1305(-)